MANLIHIIVLISCTTYNYVLVMAAPALYNVLNFGAKPDGKTDSSNAFLAPWKQACASTQGSIIYVPKGTFALNKQVAFQGPCKNNAIAFLIDGTLLAPSNYQVLGNSKNWILFENVDGVKISGGVLNGQGAGLWSCKNSHKSCPIGAMSLEFTNSKHIIIKKLVSINSQMFHVGINDCENVQVVGMKAFASINSPNTDGIHVEKSKDVTILNSKFGTGDDCISIGPGTYNVWIQNVICGPGHGISIGSLGKDLQEDGVENVTITSSTIAGTTNGVRIKTWPKPSSGFARNIHFQHITMINVQNPIIIDQNYCSNGNNCHSYNSGVKISDVTYLDIHGSSATELAVKFDCSKDYPCTGIKLQAINLNYKNQPPQASCKNAAGTAIGSCQPRSCL